MNLNIYIYIYIYYLIFVKFFIYRDIEIELSHHVSHDTTLMYLTCTIVELSIIYLNEMMRSITYFVTQFAVFFFFACNRGIKIENYLQTKIFMQLFLYQMTKLNYF